MDKKTKTIGYRHSIIDTSSTSVDTPQSSVKDGHRGWSTTSMKKYLVVNSECTVGSEGLSSFLATDKRYVITEGTN